MGTYTVEVIHLNVTFTLDSSSDVNMLNAMNMFNCSLLYSMLYFLLLAATKIQVCQLCLFVPCV